MLLSCRRFRATAPALATAFSLTAFLPASAAATTLLCSAGGTGDGSISARVGDPWGDAPVLQGKGDPLPVTKFVRGRTIIFDARSEVLYFDTANHAFAYTQMGQGKMATVRGTCEEGA